MELSLVYGRKELETEFEEASYCYTFKLVDGEGIIWGSNKNQLYRTNVNKTVEDANKLFYEIYNDGNNCEFIKDYKLTRITKIVDVDFI